MSVYKDHRETVAALVSYFNHKDRQEYLERCIQSTQERIAELDTKRRNLSTVEHSQGVARYDIGSRATTMQADPTGNAAIRREQETRRIDEEITRLHLRALDMDSELFALKEITTGYTLALQRLSPLDRELLEGLFRSPKDKIVHLAIVHNCDEKTIRSTVETALLSLKKDAWIYAAPPLHQPGELIAV
jgi:hypothetical protein